ncbi:helix-turn-helix domain-containing protein [Listeria aquatica]|uniref:HTH cro/C1-type domain-containing protein n=1 Tax=Listeria aquatica FSL S10-1188 TaxID=1265818 RepID=W7AW64_9LIST|nr:helix-turn-helix domain-containing protein [Listeria aquatica]EUJ17480.1 hypothetical protein MAQA_13416 [Listeria aquatica FSL S10-1188]
MAKIIFVKDEENQFQAYDFIHDLIEEQPLMATLLLQGIFDLENAETRRLSTGKQIAPDIHLSIGKSQAYSLQSTRIETTVDQPLHELKLHFKDRNCRLIYFTAFSDSETYYCFIKGYFKDKNPFTDQMGAYREEAKRIFLSRTNSDLSIGNDAYSFDSLKELAYENEGIVHYLESISAMLARVIFAKRIEKKWSQLDLALKSDLSPTIIERIEAGDPDLTLRMYQKTCAVLEIKLSFDYK